MITLMQHLTKTTDKSPHLKKRTLLPIWIWLLPILLAYSCSSNEEKLSTIQLPTVNSDTAEIDTRKNNNVFTDLPTPPVVEKEVSPKKTRSKQKVKNKNNKPLPTVSEQQKIETSDNTPQKIVEEEVFMRAEQMPRFPGCENFKLSNDDKAKCAEKKLFEYIRTNLKYPLQALKNNLQGEVLIKFIVDKEGNINQAELVSDPGSGMGKAALDVVNGMNDLNKKWTPGYQQGKPVSVWFVLPVRFSLGEKSKPSFKQGNY